MLRIKIDGYFDRRRDAAAQSYSFSSIVYVRVFDIYEQGRLLAVSNNDYYSQMFICVFVMTSSDQ